MKNRILGGLAVVIVLLYASCTTSTIDDDSGNQELPAEVSYSEHVQAILSQRCTNCHGGNEPSAGLSLTTYEDARFSTEQGSLLNRIEDVANPMPQNGLMPVFERNVIAKWADDGYLQ